MNRMNQLGKLLDVAQFKPLEKPTNDFVHFEIVGKSKSPKKLGVSVNGMLYHNQYILNMREVHKDEKIKIIAEKP